MSDTAPIPPSDPAPSDPAPAPELTLEERLATLEASTEERLSAIEIACGIHR